MAKALVVVESPAKAKTINKYLGKDFKVVASMGHIKDLPKSKLGVDIEGGFEPSYEIIPSRRKVLAALREAARQVKDIYVATDPDREGEAIGWHVAEELGGRRKRIHRLMFNEITKRAVLAALERPGTIDKRMVDAQQARRVLDRLVGYKISPLLWEKVRRGLSAGRVQSVALKLVCDREREIERFVPEEYWHLVARLAGAAPPEFEAKLLRKGDEPIRLANEAEVRQVLAELEGARFVVRSVATKERKKSPPPPFITSKLQQAARFPVKKTMRLAQELYEGIDLPGEGSVGLITYMRTDSTRVSEQALAEVREYIARTYGPESLPEQPNVYRVKPDAQDAHEAIRPTSLEYEPERVRPYLTRDQYWLYRLIWNRFVASQMLPAVFDETTVEIEAGPYVFRARGAVLKSSGWLAVYGADEEPADRTPAGAGGETGQSGGDEEAAAGVLPPLAAGDVLELRALTPQQKFTQPPPRYTEATLVKALEEQGIGRPSTYAQILSIIQVREYVEKVDGRFKPTRLGMLVTDLLTRSFDDILDVEYTAQMEEQLDKIETGQADYVGTLTAFYEKFSRDLDRAMASMPNVKTEGLPSEERCDKCGSAMVIKAGRFGLFLACSAYPACQNTRELETPDNSHGGREESEVCERCGRPMVVKRGRFGQFLACSGYPDCRTTRKLIATTSGLQAARPDQLLDERCPQCGAPLVVKHGRFGQFTACSEYPRCRYVKLTPTGVRCPREGCGGELVERKSRRGRLFYGCSRYPACDFTVWHRPVPETCPECGASFLVEKTSKRQGRQWVCMREGCGYARPVELTPQVLGA
jgi:DNA topoisomerase-1